MRLMSREATSPAMSEIARPWKIGSNNITVAPTTTASAVSSIGRKRTAPASTTASPSGIPSASRCSIKSTRMMELRTTMPAPAMKPIIDVAVKKACSAPFAVPFERRLIVGERQFGIQDFQSRTAPAELPCVESLQCLVHFQNGINRAFDDASHVTDEIRHWHQILVVDAFVGNGALDEIGRASCRER